MYEDRKMNKQVGGKMMKLDPVIVLEPRKEIWARKIQPSFKIRCENDNLARIFIQKMLTQSTMPLDQKFRRQKTRGNKGFQVSVWTLTWRPPLITGRLRLHLLPLSRLIGRHPEVHRSLHAHAMANLTQESGTREGEGEGKGLDLEMLRRAENRSKNFSEMAAGGVKPNLPLS